MKKTALMLLLYFILSQLVFAQKEIKFWQFWNEDWIKPSIEKFEAENPDIKVVVERLTWDQGFNKIITAMAANQAPDVLEIGSTWVAPLGVEGGLLEVQPRDLIDKFSSWVVYDEKYYAYPWTTSTTALFYNEDLLKKAGVKELPKNWEELFAASKAIYDKEEGVYGYGLRTGAYSTWQKFLPFAWSNSARLLNVDGKTTDVNKPKFLEAVTFYQNLSKVGLVDENVNVRTAFQNGKVGFMLDDPGQIKKFQKESPDLKFKVMRLPPQKTNGKSINFAGAQMLAITKNAKNPEEAERFIQFMIRTENAKAITSRITTLFPAEKTAINDDFYQKEHPELLIFIETQIDAISPVAHPLWSEIEKSFNVQLESVLLDISSPEEAMEVAEEEINDILSRR